MNIMESNQALKELLEIRPELPVIPNFPVYMPHLLHAALRMEKVEQASYIQTPQNTVYFFDPVCQMPMGPIIAMLGKEAVSWVRGLTEGQLWEEYKRLPWEHCIRIDLVPMKETTDETGSAV